MTTVSAILLYLASTPLVAEYLFGCVVALADAFSSLPSDAPPGAIIVLASVYRHGQRYTVGPLTLERLAEAARQQRHLGLPVLVSGGRPDEADDSLAGMLSTALQTDFGMPVRWREDRPRNTFEHAAFAAEILRGAGVQSALLVTDSLDMARALWSFRTLGYPVIPAAPGQQAIGRQRNRKTPPILLSSFFDRLGLVSHPVW